MHIRMCYDNILQYIIPPSARLESGMQSQSRSHLHNGNERKIVKHKHRRLVPSRYNEDFWCRRPSERVVDQIWPIAPRRILLRLSLT